MITDADIKKMKAVFVTKDDMKAFVTKDDIKSLSNKFDTKFSTKEELKQETGALNKKINVSIREVLDFISETKSDIMKELNDFRNEMRDINVNNQSILNNHESRISQLEYVNKSS